MWGENVCTGQILASTIRHLIRLLSHNSANNRTTTLHTCITSSVPKLAGFLLKNCLTVFSTSAPIFTTEHSASTPLPTKRRYFGGSKHVFIFRNVQGVGSATTAPSLKSFYRGPPYNGRYSISDEPTDSFSSYSFHSRWKMLFRPNRAAESLPFRSSNTDFLWELYCALRTSHEIPHPQMTTVFFKCVQPLWKR